MLLMVIFFIQPSRSRSRSRRRGNQRPNRLIRPYSNNQTGTLSNNDLNIKINETNTLTPTRSQIR